MNPDCPPLESIQKLLALDPDDPRRRHLEECPRCHARLISFRAFMEVSPVPEGARLEEARSRLSEAVRREAVATQPIGRSRPFGDLWARLSRPIWRPALGLASLLLAIAVLVHVGDRTPRAPIPTLRGGEVLREVERPVSTVMPDGSLDLRWRATEGADNYRLHFYSTDLTEILTLESGADTSMVLPRTRVGQLGAGGSTVYWRAEALRGGDRIALTQPLPVLLPR